MNIKRAIFVCALIAFALVYFLPSGGKSPGSQAEPKKAPAFSRTPPAVILPPKQTKLKNQDRAQAKLLAQRIREENYCDPQWTTLAQATPVNNPRRKMVVFDALKLAAREKKPDPCTRAMFAGGREEVLALTLGSDEPSCRFIRGLLLTGQWEHGGEGRPNTAAENQEGLQLLRALVDANPNNGVYSFFELGATEVEDDAAQERAYGRMVSAERFDNPLQASRIELSRLGYLNGTAFLYGSELLASSAGPNLGRGSLSAMSFARKGIYPAEFNSWVERIGAKFQRADIYGYTLPFANLEEDASLRTIALSGRKVLQRVPPILEQEKWVAYFRRRSGLENFDSFVELSQNCDQMMTKVRAVQPQFQADYERQAALWQR